jgi:hypothetical protein
MRAPSVCVLIALASLVGASVLAQPGASPDTGEPRATRFPGMDESVNESLAEGAGAPARTPYLDVESLGDLWNLILLLGGGLCGFIVGRYWDHLWGRPK